MFDLLGPLSSQAPSVQNPLSLVSLETLLGFVVFRPGSFSASRGRFGRDGGGFRELSRACAGTVNLPPALFHYRNPLSINPPSTLAFLSSQLPPFALSYRRHLCYGGAARRFASSLVFVSVPVDRIRVAESPSLVLVINDTKLLMPCVKCFELGISNTCDEGVCGKEWWPQDHKEMVHGHGMMIMVEMLIK
jgi:hypothetical protein